MVMESIITKKSKDNLKLPTLQQNKIIDELFLNNCINIYMLYNIYKKLNYLDLFYTSDLTFFLVFNNETKELFIHTSNFSNTFIIKEFLVKSNFLNLNKIKYICGKEEDINILFSIFPSLYSKVIFYNTYFFYSYILNEESISSLDNFINTNLNLKMLIPYSKNYLIKLLNLQIGYLIEEMRYKPDNNIKKIAWKKLLNIFRDFKLFFAILDKEPVAKCEWNAFTQNIFQIGGVYTSQKFRNMGISSFLLSSMLKYSYENLNYKYATLFVRKDNMKAINLYEKIGFIKNIYNLSWLILNN